MKIGKFSKMTGLSVLTIRYYIDLGLFMPQRSERYGTSQRRTCPAQLRLRAIKAADSLCKQSPNYFPCCRAARCRSRSVCAVCTLFWTANLSAFKRIVDS